MALYLAAIIFVLCVHVVPPDGHFVLIYMWCPIAAIIFVLSVQVLPFVDGKPWLVCTYGVLWWEINAVHVEVSKEGTVDGVTVVRNLNSAGIDDETYETAEPFPHLSWLSLLINLLI